MRRGMKELFTKREDYEMYPEAGNRQQLVDDFWGGRMRIVPKLGTIWKEYFVFHGA